MNNANSVKKGYNDMLKQLDASANPIYITKKKITKPGDFDHHKLIKTPSKFQLFKKQQIDQGLQQNGGRQDKRNISAATAKLMGTGTTRASQPEGKAINVVQEGNASQPIGLDGAIVDNGQPIKINADIVDGDEARDDSNKRQKAVKLRIVKGQSDPAAGMRVLDKLVQRKVENAEKKLIQIMVNHDKAKYYDAQRQFQHRGGANTRSNTDSRNKQLSKAATKQSKLAVADKYSIDNEYRAPSRGNNSSQSINTNAINQVELDFQIQQILDKEKATKNANVAANQNLLAINNPVPQSSLLVTGDKKNINKNSSSNLLNASGGFRDQHKSSTNRITTNQPGSRKGFEITSNSSMNPNAETNTSRRILDSQKQRRNYQKNDLIDESTHETNLNKQSAAKFQSLSNQSPLMSKNGPKPSSSEQQIQVMKSKDLENYFDASEAIPQYKATKQQKASKERNKKATRIKSQAREKQIAIPYKMLPPQFSAFDRTNNLEDQRKQAKLKDKLLQDKVPNTEAKEFINVFSKNQERLQSLERNYTKNYSQYNSTYKYKDPRVKSELAYHNPAEAGPGVKYGYNTGDYHMRRDQIPIKLRKSHEQNAKAGMRQTRDLDRINNYSKQSTSTQRGSQILNKEGQLKNIQTKSIDNYQTQHQSTPFRKNASKNTTAQMQKSPTSTASNPYKIPMTTELARKQKQNLQQLSQPPVHMQENNEYNQSQNLSVLKKLEADQNMSSHSYDNRRGTDLMSFDRKTSYGNSSLTKSIKGVQIPQSQAANHVSKVGEGLSTINSQQTGGLPTILPQLDNKHERTEKNISNMQKAKKSRFIQSQLQTQNKTKYLDNTRSIQANQVYKQGLSGSAEQRTAETPSDYIRVTQNQSNQTFYTASNKNKHEQSLDKADMSKISNHMRSSRSKPKMRNENNQKQVSNISFGQKHNHIARNNSSLSQITGNSNQYATTSFAKETQALKNDMNKMNTIIIQEKDDDRDDMINLKRIKSKPGRKKLNALRPIQGNYPVKSDIALRNIKEQYEGDKYTQKMRKSQSRLLQSMRSQTEQRMSKFKEVRDLSPNDQEEKLRDSSYENDKQKYKDLAAKQDQILKDIKELEDQIEYKYKQDYSLEKCSNCMKYRPKRLKKRRAIDASPMKFRNGRANSAHKLQLIANTSYYQGSEDGRRTMNNSRCAQSRDKSINSGARKKLERNNQQVSDAKSAKIELAKAYGISKKNQEDYWTKNAPDNRFFRLYVFDKESQNVDGNEVVNSRKKGQMTTQIASISPKTSRRKINALRAFQSERRHETVSQRRSEEKKRLKDKIEMNSLEQNVRLYHSNRKARHAMDARAKFECDCSQRSQGQLNRSCSKSVRSLMGSKKDKYSVLQESIEEYANDTEYKKRQGHGPHGFIPCRRICSTIHNPAFHINRYGRKKRGTSADDTKQRKKAGAPALDWKWTEINEYVNVAKFDIELSHHETTQPGMTSLEELDRSTVMGASVKSFKTTKDRELKTDRAVELQDMKHLFKKVDLDSKQQQSLNILSAAEVVHYATLIKEQSLRETVLPSKMQQERLLKKAQKTLQVLMLSLMLSHEYEILQLSYQNKLNSDNLAKQSEEQQESIRMDTLAKILFRCKKMYEVKHLIVRILVKTKKRENMLNQFEYELDEIAPLRAKDYYYQILKMSCRIYNQVEHLRNDNPLLNRPFIFNKVNLQSHIIKQVLNIRRNLMKRFKSLKNEGELDQVLDKTGKIVKVQDIITLNQEIDAMNQTFQTGFSKLSPERKKVEREVTLNRIRDGVMAYGQSLQ